MVIVVGANNSSNSLRLREAAEAEGLPAYLVSDPQDIKDIWLHNMSNIGITSGASTPEWLVDAVIQKLQPRKVQKLAVMEENVTFVLPKELQKLPPQPE